MPVKFEVKGSLARLLATEDLIVEHKKVETACFNVHTRCLTLPMWEKASDNIYTMLVLHEISHALWTPDEDWIKERKIPPQFLNIVEDARVEKLCKRKYPGSPKSFYKGYGELNNDDFFQLGDEDISTYNLADRANLYFKVGNFLFFDFTVEEQKIINQIGDAETFAEALDAAEVLYKYCKTQKEEQEQQEVNSSDSNQTENSNSSSASDFGDTENEETEIQEDKGTSPEQQEQISENTETTSNGGEDPSVKTVDALEDALKDLVSTFGYENVYLEIPKVNLDTVIIDNNKIHNVCDQHWDLTEEYTKRDDLFIEVDQEYLKFKNSAQKEVNYLVKEFECKKSADAYARSATARTGVLDCSKLHTYKYNEDLFKKVTTLANGKNHGLVFILDWSGSMAGVLMDTIKQLYNLIWFCKKVSIPFEVYTFTNEWAKIDYDDDGKPVYPQRHYEAKENLLNVDTHFNLLNFFTSKTNTKTLEKQLKNVFRLASVLSYRTPTYSCDFGYPPKLSLSGTPLNEALISLHEILPTFQKENKLQKVQCVILTDGEAQCLKRHVQINRPNVDPYFGLNHIDTHSTFLRDRKTGNTYSLASYKEYPTFTDLLLKNLRDKFNQVNFIGMRIIANRDANNFIRLYTNVMDKQNDDLQSSWKKNKSFVINNSGYHKYFGLSSSALNNDTEFEVSEDATKSQIKSAFVKSLSSKKMNKKVLSEFMELVA